jgi:hypothetical protein
VCLLLWGPVVTYLIDGYNLMHAVGMLGTGTRPKGLEAARTRFLDWLAAAAGKRPGRLRVVFDAEKAPGRSPEASYRGVWVRFAFRRTADDEIEELLAVEKRPAAVTVVSNDLRVRDAGRHRGCGVLACEGFVDWLIAKPAAAAPPAAEEPKPQPEATPDEMAAWLAAFTKPPKREPPA